MIRNFLMFLCAAWLLAGCASSGGSSDLKVHHINSLASVNTNDGGFKGLEFLADPIPSHLKNRVNIVYLHGIGWTEDRTADALGSDFLHGIAKAYKLDETDGLDFSLCGEAPLQDNITPKSFIHIKSTTPRYYETAIRGSQIKLNEIACLDKQVLSIDDNLEFVLYRVFWDNIFWNDIQFAHVGQDDNQGSSMEIAGLRRKYNRILKDDLVNYGFSDAVMYLGPAGEEIRNAVSGAMCAAALDAAGVDFKTLGSSVKHDDVCRQASHSNLSVNQFSFVAESLGSKIIYDVMVDSLTDGVQTIHDDMIRGSETYMLANQIALLSISDLSLERKTPIALLSDKDRPKIIAMSELNDFLSYELVPFYEQLWRRSIRPENDHQAEMSEHLRRELTQRLGFEMIDMRLEFADKIIPIVKGFVDPKQAHSGHSGEPDLLFYLLCGAENGTLNEQECLATELQN